MHNRYLVQSFQLQELNIIIAHIFLIMAAMCTNCFEPLLWLDTSLGICLGMTVQSSVMT